MHKLNKKDIVKACNRHKRYEMEQIIKRPLFALDWYPLKNDETIRGYHITLDLKHTTLMYKFTLQEISLIGMFMTEILHASQNKTGKTKKEREELNKLSAL